MRRIQLHQTAWMVAQTFKYKSFANDDKNPNQSAGIHTELLFKAMWEASDVLTTRQIEVWHDPKRRFMTCDAPVLVPFRRNVRPSLLAAQYIIWPVSPQRVVALSHDAIREKAVIREATGELVGMVRNSIEQGRERMIFATEGQRDRLPRQQEVSTPRSGAPSMLRPKAERRLRTAPWMLHTLLRSLCRTAGRGLVHSGPPFPGPRYVHARLTTGAARLMGALCRHRFPARGCRKRSSTLVS